MAPFGCFILLLVAGLVFLFTIQIPNFVVVGSKFPIALCLNLLVILSEIIVGIILMEKCNLYVLVNLSLFCSGTVCLVPNPKLSVVPNNFVQLLLFSNSKLVAGFSLVLSGPNCIPFLLFSTKFYLLVVFPALLFHYGSVCTHS